MAKKTKRIISSILMIISLLIFAVPFIGCVELLELLLETSSPSSNFGNSTISSSNPFSGTRWRYIYPSSGHTLVLSFTNSTWNMTSTYPPANGSGTYVYKGSNIAELSAGSGIMTARIDGVWLYIFLDGIEAKMLKN